MLYSFFFLLSTKPETNLQVQPKQKHKVKKIESTKTIAITNEPKQKKKSKTIINEEIKQKEINRNKLLSVIEKDVATKFNTSLPILIMHIGPRKTATTVSYFRSSYS